MTSLIRYIQSKAKQSNEAMEGMEVDRNSSDAPAATVTVSNKRAEWDMEVDSEDPLPPAKKLCGLFSLRSGTTDRSREVQVPEVSTSTLPLPSFSSVFHPRRNGPLLRPPLLPTTTWQNRSTSDNRDPHLTPGYVCYGPAKNGSRFDKPSQHQG